MSAAGARAVTPLHCPFCGDEDLRPVEDDAAAWSCRSCAHVFSVTLLRIDHAAIPAHRTAAAPATRGSRT
jgi:ribosomal protein L37AE/L43A